MTEDIEERPKEMITKKAKIFKHTDGQYYYAKERKYKYLREITGMPLIKINLFRAKKIGTLKDKFGRRIAIKKPVKTPRSCRFYRSINHNWTKLGAPQRAVIGNVGQGKTTLTNLIVALERAKGKRIIYFVDRRMEVRSLAWHGYYVKGVFHPFKLRVYIPKDYKFLAGNHLWDHRSNVTLHEFDTLADIIKATEEPDTIICIYDEAFDSKSRINLLEAIGHEIAKSLFVDDHYVVVHNELETIIEESPEKDVNKAVRALARTFVTYRKDRIGLTCCFHMPEEVFFKVTRKFNIVYYKQPSLKRNMNLAEFDAKNFNISQVNISRGGRWTKHTIGVFPEVKDMFRSLPADNPLSFESINPSENADTLQETDMEEELVEKLFAYIKSSKKSDTQIGKELGVSQQFVSRLVNKRRKQDVLKKLEGLLQT